jgi:hypothetical protein
MGRLNSEMLPLVIPQDKIRKFSITFQQYLKKAKLQPLLELLDLERVLLSS